ncbi:MAG: 50S ribosomal protein L29 [Candidatus Lokiarchaeota archaeon]|nr:50S ribosomal protein L29 [Candidatus Lokiarchaeota archaeon]
MAILRSKEIRTMEPSARLKKLNELQAEYMQNKAKMASGGALENPGRIKALRRTIARLITIIKEEESKAR